MFDAVTQPRRTKHKQHPSDLDRWVSDAFAAIQANDARPEDLDTWTPKAVGERLIEALRWARYSAGRTGPSGAVGIRWPEAKLSLEDRMDLWGLPEVADPEDVPPIRITPSAAQVSRYEAVLAWPATYLVPMGHTGSARMLGLWAASRAYRLSFDQALQARGVGRSLAYRMRDRGLSLIAQGLHRDGVRTSS
ncbi:hypothetical protein [Tabrizicola aquatica]|uniref:hypothetical protein n=1 Tax=Tabrizicola aquatica TaxID=909926 RepID=UPI001FE87744|nr:hypothetical protein [Tabrizicola aquatica]